MAAPAGLISAAVEEGSTHGVGFRIGAGLSGASEGLRRRGAACNGRHGHGRLRENSAQCANLRLGRSLLTADKAAHGPDGHRGGLLSGIHPCLFRAALQQLGM